MRNLSYTILYGIVGVSCFLLINTADCKSTKTNNDDDMLLNNISKSAAKKELKSKYFITKYDTEEFEKAIKNNELEKVHLFVRGRSEVPYDYLGDAIQYGCKSNDWRLLEILSSEPKNCIDAQRSARLGTSASGRLSSQANPPKYILDNFNYCMTDLQGSCEQQDKLFGRFFDAWNSSLNYSLYHHSGSVLISNTYNVCLGTFKMFLDKYPKRADLYLNSLQQLLTRCFSSENQCPAKEYFWDDANQEYINKVLEYIKAANQTLCEDGKITSCKALKDFKENIEDGFLQAKNRFLEKKAQELNQKIEEEKRLKRPDTPEGLFDFACALVERINMADYLMERQKKIGQVSGVVNQAVLYNAGDMKVTSQEFLEQVKRKYAKKTGKALDLSKCK